MSSDYQLDWPEALQRRKANGQARWQSIAADFEGEVWPEISPSFRIRTGESVFTIGSCFARNIETNLQSLGCRVPMLSLDIPSHELYGQSRSAMNRFHPPAFRQCLEWTAAIFDRDGRVTWADCADFAFACGGADDEFFDMDMAGGVPVSRSRFIERRQHIYDVFSTVFSAACMMMTPGVAEAFKDRQTGLYLFGAPTHKAMFATPERWEFETLSYERCLEDLLAAIDVVRSRNPGVNVLVTTSPVPLGLTFSGRDVRIANSYSKAVLRAVCDVAAARRPMVDYFPSYETVTLSAPHLAWHPDRIHVSPILINKIVGRMIGSYIEGVDPVAQRLQNAFASWMDGDLEATAAALDDVLGMQPNHFDARLLLVDLLAARQEWETAEQKARVLHALEPKRADVLIRLARVLAGQERGEAAMDSLAAALELPGLTQSDVQKSLKMLARAPPGAALPVARRVVELYPTQAEFHAPLVQLLIRAESRTEALAALRRALGLAHPPLIFRVWLADLLASDGDLDGAMNELDAVLAAEPDHPAALKVRRYLSQRERAVAKP